MRARHRRHSESRGRICQETLQHNPVLTPEEASAIDGVRVLRFRVLESQQGLREETHHRHVQMSEMLAQLREQLEITQGARNTACSVAPALDRLPASKRARTPSMPWLPPSS